VRSGIRKKEIRMALRATFTSVITILTITILAALEASGTDGPKPVVDPSVGDGGVSVFYVWDKTVPGTPGELLRQEPLAENLMLANASKGLRVLYTSTNGLDNKTPVTVSGAIYFPKGAPPTGGWPIIAWAHGTTGIADVCAPSWAPRSQRDIDYLNSWLDQGYAIVATDYQGLGTPGAHPYHVSKAEGLSVLDSVRAALKAFPQLANSVVIVGQSQGGHAALSASLLARDYSPGIKLLGTVATGVSIYAPFVPQTEAPQVALPQRTGGGANAVYPILNLYAFMALDRGFNPSDYLSDAATLVFDLARTACLPDLALAAERNQVTVENGLKKTPDEAIAHAASYERYPTPRFAQPVFIGSGLADVTAFPEGQYNFVMAACYAGSIVEAHYYPGKDHGGTVNASLVDSVPFVKKVFAHQSIAGNCSSVQPPPKRN
jgi:pimeloyl-ACP methyl ester carboxylesterase